MKIYLFFGAGTFDSMCHVLFFYKITLTSTTLIGFNIINFNLKNLLALAATNWQISEFILPILMFDSNL